MAEQKSIYELISDNIINGKLDENFVLPDDSEGPVKFAAGAMDGMCVYHMRPYEMTTEDYNILEKSVAAVAKGDFEQTDKLWAELGKSARAIQVVDQFQQYIQEHADEIDVKAAYPCVFDIVCKSDNKESIKFALEFMELLDTSIEPVKKVIRTLSLSNEFTIFCAWIIRNWDNGNNELFELAQKVDGWGRIHIIELLEPDTEEIRKWLLTEGTKNDVVYAYSALTCWEKSDAEERLYNSDLSYEEYSGLLTLTDALLDEGPVWGISQIENADEILSDIVSRANEYTLSIDDYETVRRISVATNDKYPFRNNLPFEEMVGEPQDSIAVGKDFESSMTYQVLLQDLRDKPFVGTDIVLKGFQCRTLTCRNAALACVKKWVKLKKMPLKELSPELFEAVSELYPAEPNENASETLKELLEPESVKLKRTTTPKR